MSSLLHSFRFWGHHIIVSLCLCQMHVTICSLLRKSTLIISVRGIPMTLAWGSPPRSAGCWGRRSWWYHPAPASCMARKRPFLHRLWASPIHTFSLTWGQININLSLSWASTYFCSLGGYFWTISCWDTPPLGMATVQCSTHVHLDTCKLSPLCRNSALCPRLGDLEAVVMRMGALFKGKL